MSKQYVPLGYNNIEEYRERTRKSKEAYWDKYCNRMNEVFDAERAFALQNITADLESIATTIYDIADSRIDKPTLFSDEDMKRNILTFRQTLNKLYSYVDELENRSCVMPDIK